MIFNLPRIRFDNGFATSEKAAMSKFNKRTFNVEYTTYTRVANFHYPVIVSFVTQYLGSTFPMYIIIRARARRTRRQKYTPIVIIIIYDIRNIRRWFFDTRPTKLERKTILAIFMKYNVQRTAQNWRTYVWIHGDKLKADPISITDIKTIVIYVLLLLIHYY